MAYTIRNTASRRIRDVLVIVDGANTNPDRAFQCAEEYIERLEKKKLMWGFEDMPRCLQGYLLFVKYTHEPGLLLHEGVPVDPRVLEPYFSKRLSDEVVPKFVGTISNTPITWEDHKRRVQ